MMSNASSGPGACSATAKEVSAPMPLKIRRARHDPALTDEQRDVLIEAYRVVIGLYR